MCVCVLLSFSVKGHKANTLGFSGHVVSVSAILLCWCEQPQYWTKWSWLWSKFLFTRMSRWIWPSDHSVLTCFRQMLLKVCSLDQRRQHHLSFSERQIPNRLHLSSTDSKSLELGFPETLQSFGAQRMELAQNKSSFPSPPQAIRAGCKSDYSVGGAFDSGQ